MSMENFDRRMLLAGLGLVGAAAAASAGAGSLTPPAGPVLPTGKTTTEIEPRTAVNATNTPGTVSSVFTITEPGSYYLTGNVTGVPGKSGVEITTGDVTLDLNGFALFGVPGAVHGVNVSSVGVLANVALLNGSIRYWPANGVNFIGSFGSLENGSVRAVMASDNGSNGIRAASATTIDQCEARMNANTGIVTNEGCTITDCVAYFNGVGIYGGNGNTISNCAAKENTFFGILAQNSVTIANCSAMGNGTFGISADFNCNVFNCTASINGSVGIGGSDGCTVTQCSANFNGTNGIAVANGCSVQGCQAMRNAQNGITALDGNAIRGCLIRDNTQNGIVTGSSGFVIDNLCDGNGLAAGTQSNIYINGSSCRVEGNAVTGGDRGIATANSTGNNLIIRNSVRGGTNPYAGIAAGNDVGPIGSAATSTSPWANILF